MRLSLALVAAAVADRESSKNAAINKVVEMLRNMQKQGQTEAQKEKVDFAAFKTWCESTQSEKKNDITDHNKAIKAAKAGIEAAEGKIEETSATIAEESKSISNNQEDLAAAKKVDTEANNAFLAEQQDLQDSLYACEKAITTLKAVPESEPAAFIQQGKISDNRWGAISALLEQAEDPFALLEQPQATKTAVEKKSNVVIEMIEDLKAGFSKELQEKTTEERNRKHAYDVMVQSTNQEIDNSKRIVAEKEVEKTQAETEKGQQEGTLAAETAANKADKKMLAEVTADCNQKEKDFNGRQKSRAAELEAIDEAIQIMTSTTMQAGAGHLDNAQAVGSFIQLRTSGDSTAKVLDFLRSQGAKIHSSALMQVVAAVEADPFAKVKEMITQLITRLKEEAKAEAEKKGWCDKEMATNKAQIEKYTSDVNKLSATKDILMGNIATAKKDIKRYNKVLKETKAALEEARIERTKSKQENEKVISESEAAVEAVENAIAVLQNYYTAGKSFIQQPAFEAGGYSGMGGQGGGVVGLMEVIQSDMRMMIEETRRQESSEATEFSNLESTSEQTLSASTAGLQKSKEDLARDNADLNATNEDLKDASMQLSANQEAKKDIDRQCTTQGVSFKDRDAKRNEEIQSLEEAMKILSNM